MNINLAQAVAESHAKLLYEKDASSITLTGGASDNRLIKKGDLFICIKGNVVDGHDFAQDAMERGAHAILAERNPFEKTHGANPPIPVLLVENSVKALGILANNRRKAYGESIICCNGASQKGKHHKVIGITGTAGKTSLKELLAHILSIDESSLQPVDAYVAKNPLNNNTQIGMPIAILNARGDEKFWVLEAGISQAKDMDELGAILEPDLAIILNAASGHTEGLGKLGVAHYKALLLKYLKKDGIAIVSKDYPELVAQAQKYRDDIVYFSAHSNCNNDTMSQKNITKNPISQASIPKANTTTASILQGDIAQGDIAQGDIAQGLYKGLNEKGFGKYCLKIKGEEILVTSPFIGSYGAENCAAAACAALALGMSKTSIIVGIETMPMPKMRFNRTQKNNWTIIDDSYNSNPLSSIRMLESAHELAKNKAFFVLMGEMKELGELTQSEHILLGQVIAKSEVKILFWVGNSTKAVKEGLMQNNFSGKFIPIYSSDEFILKFKENFKLLGMKENLVLFKGSRSNHLENYVTSFTEYCDAL